MAEGDVGTPTWWLTRLNRQLSLRQKRLALYDDYYSGEHRLLFASRKFRTAFGQLFKEFSDNWCELVVDAVEERLNIEGFRLGEKDADKRAWRIWQANSLDADSQVAHVEALIYGTSFVLVDPFVEAGEIPVITPESPRQVIVAHVPGSRRARAAALKRWVEDDGTVMATLYLPDGIFKWESKTAVEVTSLDVLPEITADTITWVPRANGEPSELPNPLGVVPMIPLANRVRLLKEPRSEIASVIPVQDGVNKLIADMLVASEFAAFRQRWAIGIEIPKDPTTGKPIEPFKAAVDRLWVANPRRTKQGEPQGDVRFGEFEQTDLGNFVEAIGMLVQHIASQTRTPPHYFYLRGEFPSGESIKSAETGLVAKARRKMRHFGESWEEVMRLALLASGRSGRGLESMETIWGDPESRSESEHIDAVLKRKALGIPQEQLWEDAGYSPAQIERFRSMTPPSEMPEEEETRDG